MPNSLITAALGDIVLLRQVVRAKDWEEVAEIFRRFTRLEVNEAEAKDCFARIDLPHPITAKQLVTYFDNLVGNRVRVPGELPEWGGPS